jgi:hypothetical protein
MGAPASALTACEMTFDLDGWSAFYQASSGTGVVACDNGQRAHVRLEGRGGGITFGRSQIVDGRGHFSPLADITEIFGNYGNAEAHAGLGVSSKAQVVTKGSVSLTLSGTGNGVDLGFAFGRFTISPSEHAEAREPRHDRRVDESELDTRPPPDEPRDRDWREPPSDERRDVPSPPDDEHEPPPPPPPADGY